VVFDGIDLLLEQLNDPSLVRREMFRLREWIAATHVTAIITAKARSRGRPARHYEFLQFMADCVVQLQHHVVGGTALRSLRVVKHRGTAHSANEIPFALTRSGIELPGYSGPELNYPVSTERISSGVERLDSMLGGGYYRGSSVLISGAPGTAKTTLGAAFAEASCRRKESTLYISFDEGPDQIVRNVASVGIDLARHRKTGLLRMHSLRTRASSPEAHVAYVRALLRDHPAQNLVLDPLSALLHSCGEPAGDHAALQVIELARMQGITLVSTSFLVNSLPLSEATPLGVSTVADTWMHV
jgi:circadian clock protein KaiC